MLHKCVESRSCSNLFRSLSLGKLSCLIRIILRGWRPESYPQFGESGPCARWSATGYAMAVAQYFTLTFERGRGMVTVPLPVRNTPVPAAHLRQMQPTVKVYRPELKGA
jgi:hypothetical protein